MWEVWEKSRVREKSQVWKKSRNADPVRVSRGAARCRHTARRPPPTAHGVLWSRPGYLVRRLNQVHYALFFEECGDARMTPVQYGLLSALRKKPRGLDQKEL